MATIEENTNFKDRCKLNFDESINFNSPVYRVFSIEKLLYLFNHSINGLVKPELWDDPFENFLLQQTIKINGEDGSLNLIRNNLYGQCWTLNKEETDALWRIYSPLKNGVRVKTTLQRLWDSFYNPNYNDAMNAYFIGKILYMKEAEIINYYENQENLKCIFEDTGCELVKTLLIKRNEFKHENEVRLIYFANASRNDLINSIYSYSIDPFALFDEILFDPRFDDGVFKAMYHEFTMLGYDESKIAKSQLYKLPKLNLVINTNSTL